MVKSIGYLILIFPCLVLGQITEKSIKVGYAGSAPFIIPSEKPEGIAIDLWREMAYNLSIQDYELAQYKSVEIGLDAVKNGQIDILIGPVTINAERAEEVSFSQPFYDTNFALLAPMMEMSIWERLSPILSMNFLYAIIGLLIILSLVGVLVWLAERKTSPEAFSNHPIKGIGTGIWLALVTMTTVGYGDFAPKTILGRFIIGSWMIISLIMATSFVAGIASTLTLTGNKEKTITTFGQLDSKKVALPPNGRLVENIRNVSGNPITVESAQEGYNLLMDGTIDAFLYDQVQLEYIFRKKDRESFALTKNSGYTQHYGFAFAKNNLFQDAINVNILEMKESGEINSMVAEWIGKK
ncbi:MAG: transporter substrate-binding domain-containing protein [Leeuwenhoekiella sp.]